MRSWSLPGALLLCAGCAATMHPLDRGEWALVWTDQSSKQQEVIPRSRYEEEVAEGTHRGVTFLTDAKAPVLAEQASPLKLTLGTVGRWRLNEGEKVDLQSDEAVFDAYWTVATKVDTWENDQAVTHKESQLFLRPKKVGKGKLKLVDATWGTHEYEVTVSAAPAK
jgi:hypothetical protein